jgi:hypothetical protein
MSEDSKPTRLPPPAFPPGSRRHPESSDASGGEGSAEGPVSQEDGEDFTFISPDEPFPERSGVVEEGTATGIGDNPHLAPEDLASGGDPHVRELVVALSKLSEAVRRRGEAGLRVTPEMTRFESTLRGYCVGYLAGRRADG